MSTNESTEQKLLSDEELRDLLADFMEALEIVASEIPGSPTTEEMLRIDAVYNHAIAKIQEQKQAHGDYLIGDDASLKSIYGDDTRNNYGYTEVQVKEAARWLQRRMRLRNQTGDKS